MKAILVIDMPECCYDCDFCRFNGGYVHGYYGRDCLITGEDVQNNNFDIIKSRHKTCPLRPMPEKIPQEMIDHYEIGGWLTKVNRFKGYNDCINEILGETEMTYTNNFIGKKRMVEALSEVYKNNEDSDIANIELKKYRKGKHEEEFIILTWLNGAISTASNNMNSLSATARNVARMLDGGVYENIDYYKDIMSNEEWKEILG